jgi:myosin heavy subunit
MRYFGLILLLVLPATGCRSRAELAKALAESKAAEAQKDSLLSEVLETTQFVSDLNSELAKAKAVTDASEGTDRGVPGAQQDHQERKATLAKIQQVIARLNESETKLIETENRAKSAKIRNARLLAQIATYKQTIEDLKTAAEQQRAENMAIIANLTGQVDELNVQTASLRDTVQHLTAYKNRVYYAIGTKDELLRNGVVAKEGKKFLFFGGTRLEPARKLNLAAFTMIDKTQTVSISLPRPDKTYKIISRQSPEFLAGEPSENGEVKGVLEIASPEEFWSASKFLILVQN